MVHQTDDVQILGLEDEVRRQLRIHNAARDGVVRLDDELPVKGRTWVSEQRVHAVPGVGHAENAHLVHRSQKIAFRRQAQISHQRRGAIVQEPNKNWPTNGQSIKSSIKLLSSSRSSAGLSVAYKMASRVQPPARSRPGGNTWFRKDFDSLPLSRLLLKLAAVVLGQPGETRGRAGHGNVVVDAGGCAAAEDRPRGPP